MDELEIQNNLQRLTGLPTVGGTMLDEGLSPEEASAMGMAMATQYMAGNGPTQPQRRKPRVMTKQQLEEQKMNEKAGYPSNLDEASKVKELESKVAGIESGISQILSKLNGGTQPYPPPSSNDLRYATTNTPTYPEHNISPSQQILQPQGRPAGLMLEQPKALLEQPSQLLNSSGSSQPSAKVVTLSDGRRIEVPLNPNPRNLGLGPVAGSPETLLQSGTGVEEDLWEAEKELVPEFVVDPKADRLATLVLEVDKWLRTKDPLTYWKRALGKLVSRHIQYNAWPSDLQQQFNDRFVATLRDPVFIRATCEKVLSCELGYALSPEKAAGLVVMAAGFVAFALAGV